MRLPFFSKRSKSVHTVRNYEHVLGTSLELQFVSETASSAERAEQVVLAEIERLEAIFNRYRPDSELNRWQATHLQWVDVSPELAFVLSTAEAWRQRSSGAFQPTVEAISEAWRCGEEAPEADFETPLWDVNLATYQAKRITPHPASLNAIAKGFIIDQAAEKAAELDGILTVLVNIGGDLRHVGEGRAPVAITHPHHDSENSEAASKIWISNEGLATSGGYRRGYQVGGQRRSHLIDPTRQEAANGSLSVSVFAPSAMLADVISTTVSVLSKLDTVSLMNESPEVGLSVIYEGLDSFQNSLWQNRSKPQI